MALRPTRKITFPSQLPANMTTLSRSAAWLHHPNWSAPDSTYTDATFGKVTSKTGQRSMQASLRYSF
jgi:hypothetical protein